IASLEYLLKIGVDKIAEHNKHLEERLINRLDLDKYEFISPPKGPTISTLVIVSHRQRERNTKISESLRTGGIDVALREGNLRLSPHLYNTTDEIDRAIYALNST
ncbi:MAG: hypothetical protein ACRD8U_20105, partial [Pyrinomonadaceae bacterium]